MNLIDASDIIRSVRMAITTTHPDLAAKLSKAEVLAARMERTLDEITAEAMEDELTRTAEVTTGGVVDLAAVRRRH